MVQQINEQMDSGTANFLYDIIRRNPSSLQAEPSKQKEDRWIRIHTTLLRHGT